jgi:hypothetical protein
MVFKKRYMLSIFSKGIFFFNSRCSIIGSKDLLLNGITNKYPDYFYASNEYFLDYINKDKKMCLYNEEIKTVTSFNFITSDDFFELKIEEKENEKIIIGIDSYVNYDFNFFDSKINKICIFFIPITCDGYRNFELPITCYQKLLSKIELNENDIYNKLLSSETYGYYFYFKFLLRKLF